MTVKKRLPFGQVAANIIYVNYNCTKTAAIMVTSVE